MILVLQKAACILFSLGILWQAWAVSRLTRTWMSPACILSLAWFLLTFIPLVALPQVPANPLAIGYILLGCVAFSIPAMISRSVTGVPEDIAKRVPPDLFDTPIVRGSFFLFSFIAFAAVVFNAYLQGVSPTALMTNFFEVAGTLIAQRYLDDNPANNIYSQIGNISCYLSVSMGGLVLPGYRTLVGRAVVIVAAMAPALFVIAIFGAKGMIFLCIAFFWGGTLVRRLFRGDTRIMEKKTIFQVIVAILLLLPFVTVSFLARGVYDSTPEEMIFSMQRLYGSYACGHLYAFSDWFTWYIGQNSYLIYAGEPPTGGFYTFTSLFLALGSEHPVVPGYYAEYFRWEDYLQSNIFTFFRGLITDYTLTGSLVALLLAGAVCNIAFRALSRGIFLPVTVSFYIFMMGYIYTSFLISLLIWNSSYVVAILQGIILAINGIVYGAWSTPAADARAPAEVVA
jgi:hypothetical protein